MAQLDGRRIAVTGATGLIGGALVEALVGYGAEVTALVRSPGRAEGSLPDEVRIVRWDLDRPGEGRWREALLQADAVVHLAGTPLFARRWTARYKDRLVGSRVQGTRQLVDAILAGGGGPEVFVGASAVGIYGTDPERVAREGARPADDFLARLCVDWEAEAHRLRDGDVRVLNARFGVVLDPHGGALAEMLPLFRFGLGAILGSPRPWINWVHRDDAVCMLVKAIEDGQLEGPYDIVSPAPVTNAEFADAVAGALGRPRWLRLPQALLELVIGEAGRYVSGGARVQADRMLEEEYTFAHPQLDEALAELLGPTRAEEGEEAPCPCPPQAM